MFEKLLEEGFLEPIDLYFADLHPDKSARAFRAAVMQSAREGHLCLDLDTMTGPQEWIEAIKSGAKVETPYIISENSLYYLTINHTYETDVAAELKRLGGSSPLPPMKAALSHDQQVAFDLVRRE